MDPNQAVLNVLDYTLWLSTKSPYVVPFWGAILWLLLLINRRASMKLLWRSLHLMQDMVLETKVFAKIDHPLKLLLLALASLPFLHLVPGGAGPVLEKLVALAIPVLTLYILVQSFDLIFFTWYLTQHREANVPTVLRFFILAGIYVVFGLAFLEWTIGVNVLPLLATSTVATAVLGLAMQDTLKNLFAGLTMSFERRFRQGDWVAFRLDATTTTTGEVLEIGWRSTTIRTVDDNVAVIPNSIFTSNQLINYCKPTRRFPRSFELPVKAVSDLAEVERRVRQAVKSIKGVLDEPDPLVQAISVRTDHVLFRVRFWVDDFVGGDDITSSVIQKCFDSLTEVAAVPALGDPTLTKQPPEQPLKEAAKEPAKEPPQKK